ncbi:MAG: hypothetical protein EPGJADBJ_04200 [Saprospiraceae bacterium]|nr:hypothetical protein [Saprospiraceae bacterium]
MLRILRSGKRCDILNLNLLFMKNAGKKSLMTLIPALLLLAMLTPVRSGNRSPFKERVFCPPPDNLSITDKSSGSVSFSWGPAGGGLTYKVWYYRQEDNFTSSDFITGNPYITFSNLPNGTYDFYFAVICDANISSFIVEEDLVM